MRDARPEWISIYSLPPVRRGTENEQIQSSSVRSVSVCLRIRTGVLLHGCVAVRTWLERRKWTTERERERERVSWKWKTAEYHSRKSRRRRSKTIGPKLWSSSDDASGYQDALASDDYRPWLTLYVSLRLDYRYTWQSECGCVDYRFLLHFKHFKQGTTTLGGGDNISDSIDNLSAIYIDR